MIGLSIVLISCTFKHSSLCLPLNYSISLLSVRFPCLVKARLARWVCAHSSITKWVNSVPLSAARDAYKLWDLLTWLCVSTTLCPVNRNPTFSKERSRLYWSTSVSVLKANPFASRSWTKWSTRIPVGPFSRTHWHHLLVPAFCDVKTRAPYAGDTSLPASTLGNSGDGSAWDSLSISRP